MVGMPGFWPGFLALDRRTGGVGSGVVGGEGGGEEKYSFTVQQGQKNIVLQLYRGSEDLLGQNLVFKNPSF